MTEGWGTPPEANATIGHNNPPEATGWGTASEAAVQLPKFEVKYKAQPETEEPEAFRLRRNAEIEAWQASKPTLDQAKQNEADLRARVTSTLFPTPAKGTQRYELGGGYKVKLVHGLAYSIGNKDATTEAGEKITIETQVRDLEDAIIGEFGQVGEALIKRLIKWKPELSGSEYEKLDANDPVELAIRDKIAELTTIKPASPQLTFEEPKGK